MKPSEARGLIKHVSKLKKIPAGKLRVLSPVCLRGLEADFYLKDVGIPQSDRDVLEAGMTLQFRIDGNSNDGFKAVDIKPVESAEYYGSVIKVPTPGDPSCKTIVSLDLTLDPVTLSSESLGLLNKDRPLRCGDYVKLVISWKDWIKALHEKKKPEWNVVKVIERYEIRPRSHSQGRGTKQVIETNGEASSDELSPQYERFTRPKDTPRKVPRRRSKSVGNASAVENHLPPPPYYPYAQPQMYPYQYPPMTQDMMYGPFTNFYSPSPMWMAQNVYAPFNQRGAQ